MDDDVRVLVVSTLILSCLIGLSLYDTYYWKPIRDRKIQEEIKKQEAIKELRTVNIVNRTAPAEFQTKRFVAEFHGEFNGGFQNNLRQIFIQNNLRQIFIIKDMQENTEYLAITGCGVSELRTTRIKSGKTHKEITEEE